LCVWPLKKASNLKCWKQKTCHFSQKWQISLIYFLIICCKKLEICVLFPELLQLCIMWKTKALVSDLKWWLLVIIVNSICPNECCCSACWSATVSLKFFSIIGPTRCTICFQCIIINSLYMFRALVHHQEALYIQQLVYFVHIMSAGWKLQPC
jgi:hypothetical protein